MTALWRAFDVAPAPWSTIYKLILLTGARRGEIEGLRIDEIRDLDGPDARLELGSRSKAGEGLDRVIALTPTAAALLRDLPHYGPFVFGADRPLPASSAVDATARQEAGLRYHWHVHGFRGLIADWLREAGVDQSAIDGVLGHQLLGARSHYGRRPPVAAMRAALEKWETFVVLSVRRGARPLAARSQ
jgi:integrase